MNDDFENRLMRDIVATARHDPTREWKAGILANAAAVPRVKSLRVPRWLLVSWASCWIATLVLYFMTPSSHSDVITPRSATAQLAGAENPSLAQHNRTLEAMLAQN